jgi:hypothetical protein
MKSALISTMFLPLILAALQATTQQPWTAKVILVVV